MKIFSILIIFVTMLVAKVDLSTIKAPIYDINDQTKSAKVNIGNLKVGQSGVIIHQFDKNNSIIIDNAKVIDSYTNYSILEFLEDKGIKQDAIPTTNLKAQKDDIFILNHLYNTSLMIVHNLKTKKRLLKTYPSQFFVDENLFAANLKLNNNPIPTKNDIVKFCKLHHIGTLFIAIDNNVYILDVNTFSIIEKRELKNIIVKKAKKDMKKEKKKDNKKVNKKDKKQTIKKAKKINQVPFYSKIEDIERGIFDFGDDEIKDFNKYYLNMMGIK